MLPYPHLIKGLHSIEGLIPEEIRNHPLFDQQHTVGLISGSMPRFPSAPDGHEGLKRDLDAMGLKYEETHGKYNMREPSFIVHNIPKETLYALGKRYGQESVIHHEPGAGRYIFCNGPNEGKYHPKLPTFDYWPKDSEEPDDYWTKVPDKGYVRFNYDFDELKPGNFQQHDQAPPSPPPPATKHEIGHKLYRALNKALAVNQLSHPQRPYPHPHAYEWHDGHTDHHFKGCGPGGVLVSRKGLNKQEAQPHPHMDAPPKNDQAAGVGAANYHQFALPFGHIDETAKARGGSNLFHYDYRGKNQDVDKLVKDHGYQTYYAGGKYGRPDLANRNYQTGHLMVYDPSPKSGGDFGDEDATAAWRGIHELAHALTYPEVNRLYGEGRRIGKLGHHRTMREAMRAVHWEDLAARKQRELSAQIGVHIPDDVFNKEYNTVLHDAAYRAVNGKFTEPSEEGFTPHNHAVPLKVALDMIRSHGQRLGLGHDDELIKKTESSDNLSPIRSVPVADQKLSTKDALSELYKGLKNRVTEFEQKCLELRKAETAQLAKHAADGDTGVPEAVDKNSMDPSLYGNPGKYSAGAPNAPGMNMSEDGALDSYAKAEKKMAKMCKACGYEHAPGRHGDKEESLDRYAKGELSKNANMAMGPNKGTLPDDKAPKEMPSSDGNKGDVKKLNKAGMAMGSAPKPPKANTGMTATKPNMPAPGGAKTPKPGATPKMPKPAGGAKPPAMGAGNPTTKAETPINKAAVPPNVDLHAHRQEQKAKLPGVRASVGNLMDKMLAAPSKPSANAPVLKPGQEINLSPVPAMAARPSLIPKVANRQKAAVGGLVAPPASAKQKQPPAIPGIRKNEKKSK